MFFESKVKKRIREVGKSAFVPFSPEKTEKFALEADFFGYPSFTLPACGQNVYVCLPPHVHVFDGNRYVYEEDALPAQFFPQGKVYRLSRPLTAVGEREEETYFSIDPEKEDFYYALLALYSLTKVEKVRNIFSRRKKLLEKGTAEEVYKELSVEKKTRKTELPYPMFPPLACLPEALIRFMLEDAPETVCFPQGGLWRGLIPILCRSGVKRVILPAKGGKKQPFCWKAEGSAVDVYYRDIFSAEERKVRSFLLGDKKEDFEVVKKIGEDETFYATAFLLKKEGEKSGEGESGTSVVTKDGISNGLVSVVERKDEFLVPEKDITLSILYRDGEGRTHRCGKVADRKYGSGRFVLFEEHFYYREETARVRLMLEGDKSLLRVDYEGVEEGFELEVRFKGAEKIILRYPFGKEEYKKDGCFFAKDKAELCRGEKKVAVYAQPMICKKEGDGFYFPLRSFFGKRSLIID